MELISEKASEMDCSDDDNFDDYYDVASDVDAEQLEVLDADPEYFKYECLTEEQVERLLNERVEIVSNRLQSTPSLARSLLHSHQWNVAAVLNRHCETQLAVESVPLTTADYLVCTVCAVPQIIESFTGLLCNHRFCHNCWKSHFETQIKLGMPMMIGCMAHGCKMLAPEDFVLQYLPSSGAREKYQRQLFQNYVQSHPELRFCPGVDCRTIVRACEPKAKRAVCSCCKLAFCFMCGRDYHAPTSCVTIEKWLRKCVDDSETANYICANTKSCPSCHICIEKNGGCNHMQCYRCSYQFCWMCLDDWKTHASQYYNCSRYRENPDMVKESLHVQASMALKKYLHYFERWENHSKSLKLEAQAAEKLRQYINTKVMNGDGTWIDWQYLFSAAELLAKCRYTLQYTYPYAYYMENQKHKELFEYQQAQLEAEIENLSWKIEHADPTDRGIVENQMNIAEAWRITLLKDFLIV